MHVYTCLSMASSLLCATLAVCLAVVPLSARWVSEGEEESSEDCGGGDTQPCLATMRTRTHAQSTSLSTMLCRACRVCLLRNHKLETRQAILQIHPHRSVQLWCLQFWRGFGRPGCMPKCNAGTFLCEECPAGTHHPLQGLPRDQTSYAPSSGLASCTKCR